MSDLLTSSPCPTDCITAEPMSVNCDAVCDIMYLVDPADEHNPLTVQHATVNGVGMVAQILRGKR